MRNRSLETRCARRAECPRQRYMPLRLATYHQPRPILAGTPLRGEKGDVLRTQGLARALDLEPALPTRRHVYVAVHWYEGAYGRAVEVGSTVTAGVMVAVPVTGIVGVGTITVGINVPVGIGVGFSGGSFINRSKSPMVDEPTR